MRERHAAARPRHDEAVGHLFAGHAFGEMALLDESPRSATGTADTTVECDFWKIADFKRFGQTHPLVIQVMMRNLALGLFRNLKKLLTELELISLADSTKKMSLH